MIDFKNLGYKDVTKDKPIRFIECLEEAFDNVYPYNKRFYKKEGIIIIELKVGSCHNTVFISGICCYPEGWEKFKVCAPKDYIDKIIKQTLNVIKTKLRIKAQKGALYDRPIIRPT